LSATEEGKKSGQTADRKEKGERGSYCVFRWKGRTPAFRPTTGKEKKKRIETGKGSHRGKKKGERTPNSPRLELAQKRGDLSQHNQKKVGEGGIFGREGGAFLPI